MQAFDENKQSVVFYDSTGDAYLTDGNKVMLCEQNVAVKSFDVSQFHNDD
jgi:hypothetical protein